MAKKFFYVCGGLFLLVLSYQFGAGSARAQAGSLVLAGSYDPDTDPCGVSAGQLYVLHAATHQNSGPYPMPESGPIVAVTAYAAGTDYVGTVVYENGNAYYHPTGNQWLLLGNVLGNYPVPAVRQTWGQVKSRYRK